jgi:transcriptional regulator with XRE-family HTH domain
MINSTLGGLIKDYRLQKGISQLDIAFALGWKEPSRLSRIEQGRTEKPPRELLDKIIKAIGLEEEEKNNLLLTGNYLPTEEEIAKIRGAAAEILDDWKYPAYLFDFSWRVLRVNKPLLQAYELTSEHEKYINEAHPHVLELLFHPDFKQNQLLKTPEAENWKHFLQIALFNFKYEQRNRTKEKWYIDHIKSLMNNDLFRELWVKTGIKDDLNGILGKFVPKNIIHPDPNKNSLLHFYRFSVPILRDPRFEIELLMPRDQETYTYYQ